MNTACVSGLILSVGQMVFFKNHAFKFKFKINSKIQASHLHTAEYCQQKQ